MENKLHKSKIFILFVAIFIAMITFSIAVFGVLNSNVQKRSVDSAAAMTIGSVSDFNSFVSRVNNGENFSGKTVELSSDINFNGETVTPVGTSSKPFKGTFDGKGYKMYNLKIDSYKEEDYREYQQNVGTIIYYKKWHGLFGITSGATVKNLHIKGASVNKTDGTASKLYIGILIAQDTGNANISQCYIEDSLISVTDSNANQKETAVGGLIGSSASCVVDSCAVVGCDIGITRLSTSYKSIPMGGGGYLVTVLVTRESQTHIGGIVGYSVVSATVKNNYYIGSMTIKTEYALVCSGIGSVNLLVGAASFENNYVQFDNIDIHNTHHMEYQTGLAGPPKRGRASSSVCVIANKGAVDNKYYIGTKVLKLAYDTGGYSNFTIISDYYKSDFTSYSDASPTDKWKA